MRSHVAGVLVLLGTCFIQTAFAIPMHPGVVGTRSHRIERSLELLDQAHGMTPQFRLEQRAWTVFHAADVAAPLDPQRARKWGLEAWELAKRLELGQSRAALQKDALRDVAVADPDLALRLYRKLDLPAQWDAVHQTTEDVRSLGYANTFFKPVWERGGPRYVARLRRLARFLGGTGQYPYAAMSRIAIDISKAHPRSARKIIQDATTYFRRDPGFTSTNKQFVRFILATRAIASAKLLQTGLNAAINGLEAPPRTFTNRTWSITIKTPLGDAKFDSEHQALLFQLLPLLKSVSPGGASQLVKRYASLRDAPAIAIDTPMTWSGSVSMAGTADSARMRLKQDESRVFAVREAAESDPKGALAVANTISDPDLRTIALVWLAPAYAKVNAGESDSWLSEAKAKVPAITEDGKRLQLLAALVRTLANSGHYVDAQPLIGQAFDLGEAVASRDWQDHPESLADSVAGSSELGEIAASVIQLDAASEAVISRINHVQNDPLRAQLLIEAARGIAEKGAD